MPTTSVTRPNALTVSWLPTGPEHLDVILMSLIDGVISEETDLLAECGHVGLAGSGVDAHRACNRNPSAAQLPGLIHEITVPNMVTESIFSTVNEFAHYRASHTRER